MVAQRGRVTHPRPYRDRPITAVDRKSARWVIEFAALDLPNLSRGEWLVVYEQLAAFMETPILAPVEWQDVIVHDRPLREGAQVPGDGELIRWRDWLQRGLTLLRQHRTWSDTVGVTFAYANPDDRKIVQTAGPDSTDLVNRFKVRVHEALGRFAARVRFCGRRECGAAFIANKRQEFCSPACSQRARTERYRAKDPERVRRRRRAAYDRAKKRKPAGRRRVGRRGT